MAQEGLFRLFVNSSIIVSTPALRALRTAFLQSCLVAFGGIYLGISLKDFLKIRPNANVHPMNMYSADQKVDLTKPNQSLYEFIENDPLFGLSMLGTYSFKDGKLRDIMLTWVGDMKKIKKHRKDFVSSCIKKWGSKFQRRIVKLEPKAKNEHLAPVLFWQKGNTIIVAGWTSKYYDKKLKEGVFMIDLFPRNDEKLIALYAGEKVSKEIREELFKAIVIDDDNNKKKENN